MTLRRSTTTLAARRAACFACAFLALVFSGGCGADVAAPTAPTPTTHPPPTASPEPLDEPFRSPSEDDTALRAANDTPDADLDDAVVLDLDHEAREAELGHAVGASSRSLEFADRDDATDRLVTFASAPQSVAPGRLPALRMAGSPLTLPDIPEVCHRDSPALDFRNGWIFFDEHCDALLAAKDELRGSVPLNWDTTIPMTQWDGVVLGTLGVERLYLHNLGLNGSIPPELGALDDLEVLSLGRNRLTGEIPTELGAMSALERLYLQDNRLTGGIPPELGTLRRLKRLYMWRNGLTGEIPPELGSIPFLERVNIGGNRLTGEIPSELGSLSRLVLLHLWQNELTGSIPRELGNLHSLKSLTVSRNKLTGSIPPELADLRNIEQLWLYDNQLTGSIPTSDRYSAWEDLRVLNLRDNQLSGPVPAELGETDLGSLTISGNPGLTGPLPLELRALHLDYFWWEGTALCSPADPSFQAWLASIAEDRHRGGPVCDSETTSGGGEGAVTFREGERIPDFPTGVPNVVSGGSFALSGGVVTITLRRDGYVQYPEHRYTCDASQCGIRGGLVTAGVIVQTAAGGGGTPNRAPQAVGSISDETLTEDGSATTVDVSAHFRDADGDALNYRATSSRTSVARVRVSGSRITLTPGDAGTATVTVTATDPGGLSATQRFTVTVESAPTQAGGTCTVGLVLRPGESCTYPGTSDKFTVNANGSATFLFFTSGRSLNIVNTTINGRAYTLVATRQSDGGWRIERVG